MIKNTASQFVGAQMITAADGTPFTGTVAVAVTKDGGAQAAGAGTVTHKGGGYHSYAPTTAETNADHVAFTFSGTGAISETVQIYTRALYPGVSVEQINGVTITGNGQVATPFDV